MTTNQSTMEILTLAQRTAMVEDDAILDRVVGQLDDDSFMSVPQEIREATNEHALYEHVAKEAIEKQFKKLTKQKLLKFTEKMFNEYWNEKKKSAKLEYDISEANHHRYMADDELERLRGEMEDESQEAPSSPE